MSMPSKVLRLQWRRYAEASLDTRLLSTGIARLISGAVTLAACCVAYAQDFPLDRVMSQGSEWTTRDGARYGSLAVIVCAFLGLAWGEHGAGVRKAIWTLICVAGALLAATWVDWLGT
jgi:hypothetical protein